MQTLCECNSTECRLTFNIPLRELQQIQAVSQIVIVDGCPTGPEPTDTLVRKESGYTIYEEG